MTNLRWYKLQDVRTFASQLKQRYDSGDIGRLEYALAASQYCLRDSDGTYLFLDIREGHLFRFEHGQWRRSDLDPDRVEGLDALVEMPDTPLEEQQDPFAGKEQWQPIEAYVTWMHYIWNGYQGRRMSSADVEKLLARLVLLDHEGGIWMSGFRSGKWFCYKDGRWVEMEQSPRPDQLVQLQAGSAHCDQCGFLVENSLVCPKCGAVVVPGLKGLPDGAYVDFFRFLLLGAGSLPEPVTDPWQPPGTYPNGIEPVVVCPVCAARNPAGSRYCNQCAAMLGCPNCGAENSSSARFCNQCGHPLVEQRRVT